MCSDDFRRLARGMKGVEEGAHMGHPDFRVNGRIFATIHADRQFGMVKLRPDQQRRLISEYLGVFVPESGAWGRAGCTRVRLASVDEDVLGEAITLAWQNIMGKTQSGRSKRELSTKSVKKR
jgi:hypothetical protein